MKNLFLAIILFGLTALLSLSIYGYCQTYVCLSADLNSVLGKFPVAQDVEFLLSDDGELEGVIELEQSVPYQDRFDIRLSTDTGLLPISVQGKYIYFPADELEGDQEAYFLWQGLKTPAFTIPQPYFTLNALQYVGLEERGHHFILEGEFPFEINPVLIAESGNEVLEVQAISDGLDFFVEANRSPFNLFFEWGDLRSKLVTVSFDDSVRLDAMPLITGLTSEAGFLPKTEIHVQGVNLAARGSDHKNLDLKWSDSESAILDIDPSFNPGELIKFRLLTDRGWTNPVQFKVAELDGEVALLPQILAISMVSQDDKTMVLDLYGQHFPSQLSESSVWFEGSPQIVLTSSENKIRLQMPAQERLQGSFIVIRDTRYPSEAFEFSAAQDGEQDCDLNLSNFCHFLILN